MTDIEDRDRGPLRPLHRAHERPMSSCRAGAPSLPVIAQIHELAAVREGVVEPDHIDLNGHMNASHILTEHVTSMRAALAGVGVGPQYVRTRGMGTFAAEQHLRYLNELRLGTRFSVRVRFLARADKALHAASYLVDESAGRVANVMETIVIHIDQSTRRATTIPDDLRSRLDAQIGASLSWEHPSRLPFRTAAG